MSSSKAAKEAAVSGHSGTTLLECYLQIACVPFILFAVEPILRSNRITNSVFLEALCVAYPTLFVLTQAADWLPGGLATFIGLCILVNQGLGRAVVVEPSLVIGDDDESISSRRKRVLTTTLRGVTVLSTVLAILAVDFPSIFPRRYVKTEWYGTSLMDIGVGAYVFTGAIVRGSRHASDIKKSAISAMPVIALGGIRAVVNKMAEYQEHVSEYGCHWNFFITLALVRLLGDVFTKVTGASPSPQGRFILGLGVLFIHQITLSNTIVGVWVMADADSIQRKQEGSIFWQNKEGLISLPGYVGVDLVIRGASEDILTANTSQLMVLMNTLIMLVVVFRTFVQDISRRSCNVSYVLFIVSIGVTILALTSLLVAKGNKVQSWIMYVFSRHQLAIFLIANLLTGLVNLSFNTLDASATKAYFLMGAYIVALCFVGYLLENRSTFFSMLHRQAKDQSK